MNNITGQPNKLVNFEELYTEDWLKKSQLPAFADVRVEDGIFRRPFIKWSTLLPEINGSETTDLFYICTDVLEIDQEVQIVTGTFLFARHIIVTGKGKLIFRATEDLAFLLVVTNQITDADGKNMALPLQIVAGNGEARQNDLAATFGEEELRVFELSSGDNEVTTYPVSELDDGYLIQGGPLRMFLRSEFQLSTLLLNSYPWESIHQLDYVGAVASAHPETVILAGQARALATTLRSTQAVSANGLLVPTLDYSIYADSAAKALNVLKLRQEQYDDLLASADNIKQWKQNAELAFAVGDEQENLTKELLLKGQKTRQQMEQARAIAARQVAAIQVSLIYKRAEFENGVEAWKDALILKNIFKIIIGVVKILAEIPTLVATGPAAVGGLVKNAGTALSSLAGIGAGLAESAINRIRPTSIDLSFEEGELDDMREIIDGNAPALPPGMVEELDADEIVGEFEEVDAAALSKAEKVRNAAEAKQKAITKEFMTSAKNVGAAGKEIADAAMDIAATVKKAAQMEAASQQALLAINRGVGKSFADITPRGLDVVTGGSQDWERLSLTVKAFFARVPDEVPGKAAFEEEYDRLIISAQAMCQARLALAKANSELAEAMLRLKSAKETAALYQRRMVSLGDKVAKDKVLSQLAYDKILDAKRSVYLYLETYRRAFIYFTLKPVNRAPALPDLSASYGAITVAVNQITNARLANKSLLRAPKKMKNVELTLMGEALTREFRESGVLQFVLKPKNELFDGYCRIRLNEIEVYAEGLTSPAKVRVELTNNGVYMDKDFSSRTRYFIADKLKSRIKYKTSDQSQTFTGERDDRFNNEFFSPTPFSTWTVAFRSDVGATIDLSDVTAVKVVFFGHYSILE